MHPFNGHLSGTTRVSWYQKGKTNMDFTEAGDSERQWHQLGHMQVYTSLQTDNHTSTLDALPAAQPTSTETSTEMKTKTDVTDSSMFLLLCRMSWNI